MNPTHKTCNKCRIEKPLSEFYIRKRGKHAGHPRSWCKACEKDHQNAKNAANREVACARAKDYAGLMCYLCKKELERPEATLDHFIPLARGGAHSLVNARVACKPCNTKKWAHLPHEIGLSPQPHLFAL